MRNRPGVGDRIRACGLGQDATRVQDTRELWSYTGTVDQGGFLAKGDEEAQTEF